MTEAPLHIVATKTSRVIQIHFVRWQESKKHGRIVLSHQPPFCSSRRLFNLSWHGCLMSSRHSRHWKARRSLLLSLSPSIWSPSATFQTNQHEAKVTSTIWKIFCPPLLAFHCMFIASLRRCRIAVKKEIDVSHVRTPDSNQKNHAHTMSSVTWTCLMPGTRCITNTHYH